jgi:hypothetical protein
MELKPSAAGRLPAADGFTSLSERISVWGFSAAPYRAILRSPGTATSGSDPVQARLFPMGLCSTRSISTTGSALCVKGARPSSCACNSPGRCQAGGGCIGAFTTRASRWTASMRHLAVMPPKPTTRDQARLASLSSVTLQLDATDDVSGVGYMRISGDPSFTGAAWEAYTTSKIWPAGQDAAVFVQYRDNAGNESVVYSAALTITHRLFLPLIMR